MTIVCKRKEENKIMISVLYGVVHMMLEIICFTILYTKFHVEGMGLIVTIGLFYDFFAFVPECIFGYLLDTNTKIPLEWMAVTGLTVSIILFSLTELVYIPLLLMTLSNAMIHEAGAVVTTRISEGELKHGGIFVAGGSFGVITGRILGTMQMNILWLLLCVVIIACVFLYQGRYIHEGKMPVFDLVKKEIPVSYVILVVLFIVAIRSYISYAIPMVWKKEVWQGILLFVVMGMGKAGGGFLADRYGSKKTGVISTLVCIPFLIMGKDNMLLSITGIYLFSLTMPITFGMVLSITDQYAGTVFGITTIALFLGSVSSFFIGTPKGMYGIIVLTVVSLASSILFYLTLKGEHER